MIMNPSKRNQKELEKIMIDRTIVLTLEGTQFIGLTVHPFFDFKIKKSLMSARNLNSSNQIKLPSRRVATFV